MRRSAPGVVVDFAEFSDPGRDPAKQVNEDSAAAAATAHGLLAVVCDGVGGHSGGREASQTAIATILREIELSALSGTPGGTLKHAISSAGRAIYAQGGHTPFESRPGSTCVAVLLGERGVVVAHVGDSRAYRLRDGRLERLTRDHSVVQQLVDAGKLSVEEAAVHPDANRITRALGVTPEVDVEVQVDPNLPRIDDVFLLCSDGLTDMVTDQDIALCLQEADMTPDLAGPVLVDLANQRGGHDNITVQLLRVVAIHESQRPRVAPTIGDGDVPSGKVSGLTQPWNLAAPRTLLEETLPPVDLVGIRSSPLPGIRAPRRSLPWPLLLLAFGTLLFGALLGALGLWWWLHAKSSPDRDETSVWHVNPNTAQSARRFPPEERFDISGGAA